MSVLQAVEPKWKTLIHEVGRIFEDRADASDREGSFVFENYQTLKEHRFFSAMVPEAFGGGGLSHREMCDLIRLLGQYCGSTALAFSMHQHLVGATIWKYRHKGEGAPVLQKVADKQLVLISTGARDWLESNGTMEKVAGGYRFTAKKAFASQSIGGDVAVTSAPYEHPTDGWQVLHFSVPMNAEGVSVLNDWDVMGMRATGSQTISFDRVFIPDNSIALVREKGIFHPVWNVVLAVAMPLIMSAYLGIAERAFEIARDSGKKNPRNGDHLHYQLGKLKNTLLAAQAQWGAMMDLTNNFDLQPNDGISAEILAYKTNIADAARETVAGAMEMVGGRSFYRRNQLERLFRDVQASQFHPLPKWEQYAFTGKFLLEE